MKVGERIKKRRKELGLSAEDLANEIGKSRATVYKYEKGDIENLPHTTLIPLAEALRTTPEYLLGWEDDPFNYEEWLNYSGDKISREFYPELSPYDRAKKYHQFKDAELEDGLITSTELKSEKDSNISVANSFMHSATIQIPVYGSVPAGVPVEALEDINGFVDIPATWADHGPYIGLTVSGSSMYPKYLEGDTVVVKIQDHAVTGQDVVAYVNGYDATLKTIVNEADGTTTLKPINPEYQTKNYPKGMVRVLGVVKRMVREI